MMPLHKRQLTVFATAILLIGQPVLSAAGPDNWNFTPEDYEALVKAGGDLTYDPDSNWFPEELKDNLKATLKHVLDPKAKKRNTAGVNTKDFYHGHVVCPRPCTEEQKAARALFDKASKAAVEKFPSPTKENFEKWKEAVEALKKTAADTLKKCLKEGCGVVYHTYEANDERPPELKGKPDGPRTNLFTPNGTNPKPEEYTAPRKPDGASYENPDYYQKKYCLILEFAFLIDKTGKIHVVPDTFRLAAATGL